MVMQRKIAGMILGVNPDAIRRRVVLAPCWSPESVGIGDAVPMSDSERVGVWECRAGGEPFTYIVGGVGAGVCADIAMALSDTRCEELLFLGSAGAIDDRMRLGDFAVIDGSVCAEGASRFHAGDSLEQDTLGMIMMADTRLSERISAAVQQSCALRSVKCWGGLGITVESIYSQWRFIDQFSGMGASFIDMESSAVLAASSVVGIAAAAVFCVSDNQSIGKSLADAPEEEVAFRKTIRRRVVPDVLKVFAEAVSVSVIVPSYNGERYLGDCLERLLEDPPVGMEVIVVDDGSTDDTRRVAEEFAKSYECVRVIGRDHSGLSAARNAGLAVARGEYVYFVDDDDLPVSGFLKKVCAKAHDLDLDLLFFSFEPFCDNDELRDRYSKHFVGAKRTTAFELPISGRQMLVSQVRSGEYYPVVWIQLVKRSLLLRNGIRFQEGLLFEDNLYTLAVILSAKRCVCLKEIGYRKRFREGSITISPETPEKVNSFLYTYRTMVKMAESESDEEVRTAIKELAGEIEKQIRKRTLRLSDAQKSEVTYLWGE